MTILTGAAVWSVIGRVMSIIGVPMLLGPDPRTDPRRLARPQPLLRRIFFINLPIGIAALRPGVGSCRPTCPRRRAPVRLARPRAAVPRARPPLIYGLAESNSSGGFGAPEVLRAGCRRRRRDARAVRLVHGLAHPVRADRPAPVQEPHLLRRRRPRCSSSSSPRSAGCC